MTDWGSRRIALDLMRRCESIKRGGVLSLRCLAASAALSAMLTPTAAHAAEYCRAIISSPGSSTNIIELTDFSIMNGAGPVALPEGLANVAAILWRRETLVMSDRDYRVLTDLHLPFAFSDGDRVVWLYVENMRLLMHMDEGELSKDEQEQINGAIERAQAIMVREGW
ncbi:MAG TPA: hypothetical protein VEA80_13720 [Vitreimonas sp.]|uniref:hypothetical protein n=1 Tax=Vitreimonas sp. TaxID=3069702 RepID=UPI002D39D55A|nr:hypothetical protein [Vitreimonas sp.]HYD88529.1 hypothetical protein [Vitreimonas sp.]